MKANRGSIVASMLALATTAACASGIPFWPIDQLRNSQ
jgi:hypothetical protein